jgi:DNA modification methylase
MQTDLTDAEQFQAYLEAEDVEPLFLTGDTLHILSQLPDNSVDFCMTSPPYWGQREYQSGGIGEEKTHAEFIQSLLAVFQQVHRVMKPTGSFWLNIGDTYQNKGLLAIPWRLAIAMIDEQGWILRNGVIWNKLKGGLDQSTDKLRNIHEDIFHFVKQPRGYYFNADAVKSDPRKAKVINGAVVSATGVSGVRYKRQIELSTSLNDTEKVLARQSLEDVLNQVRRGELDDFRMVIRGQHRTTHSDSEKVSGRAKELRNKGFYFLKYDPKGTKPSDVWEILPEDKTGITAHYAPYPEALCIIPMLATCPPHGIVLDMFSGTGTTNLIAKKLGRKSIGIDISPAYISIARHRTAILL